MAALTRITKRYAADLIQQRIIEITGDCQAMKTEGAAGNYYRVVSWPTFAFRFHQELQNFQDMGYTFSELGKLIVDDIETDPTRTWETHYAAQFSAFRTALIALLDYIKANIGNFPPSYNATNTLVFVTSNSNPIRAGVVARADAILATVPGL